MCSHCDLNLTHFSETIELCILLLLMNCLLLVHISIILLPRRSWSWLNKHTSSPLDEK